MYEQGQCGIKEDDDPCEDFVPRYFKDTGSYMYIDNKWFKLTVDRDEIGREGDNKLHPARFTNKQVGWIEHLIRREFRRVGTSEYLADVCQSILFAIRKSVKKG